MKVGERKILCKCPACPKGEISLIKLKGDFKFNLECDNSQYQTHSGRQCLSLSGQTKKSSQLHNL